MWPKDQSAQAILVVGGVLVVVVGVILFLNLLLPAVTVAAGLFVVVVGGGLAAASPALVSLSAIAILLAATGVGLRTARPIAAVAVNHPFETISGVVTIVLYFGADLAGKAAGLGTPHAEIAAALNALLVFLGGHLVRRRGFLPKFGATALYFIGIVVLVVVAFTLRPVGDIETALAGLGPWTFVGIGLLLVTAVVVSVLALTIHRGGD